MPIEHHNGCTTITGKGDLPQGGLSFYTLIIAHQAMKMHVQSNGRMKLTRIATPKNIRFRLNQEYPDRPDGPFTGKTAKKLLAEIVEEVQRQHDLHQASMTAEQKQALERILNER